MEELIFDLAKGLGHVTGADEDILRRLCPGAADELRQRLRPGLTAEYCESAFLLGAAWLALAALAAAQDDGVERTTAGDVTIQRGPAAERIQQLRGQAERVMGPYLRDQSFFFRGVMG